MIPSSPSVHNQWKSLCILNKARNGLPFFPPKTVSYASCNGELASLAKDFFVGKTKGAKGASDSLIRSVFPTPRETDRDKWQHFPPLPYREGILTRLSTSVQTGFAKKYVFEWGESWKIFLGFSCGCVIVGKMCNCREKLRIFFDWGNWRIYFDCGVPKTPGIRRAGDKQYKKKVSYAKKYIFLTKKRRSWICFWFCLQRISHTDTYWSLE